MSLTSAPLQIATPVTLEGSVVRLEPIRREHAELFWQVAQDALDNIFQWIPYRMKTPEDFERLVEKALAEQERGESVVFATVERNSGQRNRQHSLHEHRSHQSQRGNWFHVDRSSVAANRRQHGSEISDAASRLRSLEMHSRRTQNRRVESEIAERDSANRRKRGRHTAQASAHLDRPRARYGLLQHSGYRVAGGESHAGNDARAERCVKECLNPARR